METYISFGALAKYILVAFGAGVVSGVVLSAILQAYVKGRL